MKHEHIIAEVESWLKQVVVGLNLCPFAVSPFRKQQIKMLVSEADSHIGLLETVKDELFFLQQKNPEEIETTLIILPDYLQKFSEYNDFLDWVDELLVNLHLADEFQVASFHPGYVFAETDVNDQQNLTNRSPYPLLHLLRQASVSQAVEQYKDIEVIIENNIKTMLSLDEQQKQKLFPYLYQKAIK